jgi:hypothetical protein
VALYGDRQLESALARWLIPTDAELVVASDFPSWLIQHPRPTGGLGDYVLCPMGADVNQRPSEATRRRRLRRVPQSDAVDSRELVSDGEIVHLYAERMAVIDGPHEQDHADGTLHVDRGLARALGESGLRRARELTWPAVVDRLLS